MRVLWLCNIMLPDVAAKWGLKASNKEGWLSGICETVKRNREFELAISFPAPKEYTNHVETIDGIKYYGFNEDTTHPEIYDESLEEELSFIVGDFKPDVVHIFGTEFPHTLAMCRAMKNSCNKVLIGMQGVVGACFEHYSDGVPQRVINRRTFRDIIKSDGIREQVDKFDKRTANEVKALQLTGNVTGRTKFDKEYVKRVNPNVNYHFMNEILRSDFYEGEWNYDSCIPHSIFLSQGNYPIKGVHYVLEALPRLKEKYPDIVVKIAGDVITADSTLKDKIKISSYGKYLLELIKKYDLKDNVKFVGNKNSLQMKQELLNCNIFVCPSTIENSPNSLGEAMLLSVPSVASDVGGITSIFDDNEDGIVYHGGDINALCDAVDKMFSDVEFSTQCGKRAHEHAAKTHNAEENYSRLVDIYHEIGG